MPTAMNDAAGEHLSVPLAALLSRKDLALRPLVTPDVPDSPVIRGAHASEMCDPFPSLLGEMLLTAGVHVPRPSQAEESGSRFDSYVSGVVAAGGAALGFGLEPVHDRVPPALVAACEKHGLPLVEVPPQTTFAALVREVWQLIARARMEEVRRVSEAQQSLAAATSAADPVASVLRRLAARLDAHAALYGPRGTQIASAGREPPAESRAALSDLARFVTDHATTTATDTVAGVRLSAYALGPGEEGFVLGLAARHREPGDQTIASVAAVLLALLTADRHSGTGDARSAALVRLLLGASPEEVAPLLGGEEWSVVHARPDTGTVDAAAAGVLGAALGSSLVDVVEGAGGVRDAVRILVPACRKASAQPGWTLGVSAAVTARHWPAADAQASRALTRALGTRTPLISQTTAEVLAVLAADAGTEAQARALLAPIHAVPALAETLRTWLSLHGSWDRTAVALSVHRNTVRQRVSRCAGLLDADLDDPDIRMGLWFALRQTCTSGEQTSS
ncbi:helix-turn-helix domain-containing protein [Streptomyces sp. NPDC057301]|uniref:helix-turn-helix domain-containing protein n=1 Tax=Streptomyces sp. NPDC057301 TaxID=3346093 RepID=UPI0036270CF5